MYHIKVKASSYKALKIGLAVFGTTHTVYELHSNTTHTCFYRVLHCMLNQE